MRYHGPKVEVYTEPVSNGVGCEKCGCLPQAPGETGQCPSCNYEDSISSAIEAIERGQEPGSKEA